MLSANKEKIQSFLMGSIQFVIPFFQRSYVWTVDNWSELWENIQEEFKEIESGNSSSEHFIGTVIIKQRDSERVGALEYDLIDGQQRLTTICLLLRAFHDITEDLNLKNWTRNLLISADSYGNQNIRILHSRVDREYFQNIILDNENNQKLWLPYSTYKAEEIEKKLDQLNNIEGAYLYFRSKISNEVDASKIRNYITIILEKLPVIHMALSKEDDVQQIFDTINSLGVKLTTAELLKNHLYAKKAVIGLYEKYWQSVFEADEDAMDFWNRERTSGRVKRTTVELFLYSYLVIQRESNVKMESLFKEFKTHLRDKTDNELIDFARDIYEFAIVYQNLPDGENLSEISFHEHDKRFFHIIREFEITTIFPLILYIFKVVKDDQEKTDILGVLESYITRRTICRLTTKNYNNLFLSLLSDIKAMDSITAGKVKEKLLQFTEVTNRFPSDQELYEAFISAHLVNKYSREVLYCIALYHLSHEYSDNSKLNIDGFSVEHMMPKKWRNNWKTPSSHSLDYRDHKLLTLGNLTLVKGKLNSSMRDGNWTKKKAALQKYSTLRQTVEYLMYDDWNEDLIDIRSKDLFDIAVEIWKN